MSLNVTEYFSEVFPDFSCQTNVLNVYMIMDM